jgi:hypothetical protein
MKIFINYRRDDGAGYAGCLFDYPTNRVIEWDRLMRPSRLAKAFRSELVEQHPNDEPASVLLERIPETKNQSPG